jgi:hypothetical protein
MPSTRRFLIAVCLLTAVAGAQHWVTDIPGTFIDISTTGGTLVASNTTNPIIDDDSEHNIVSTVGNAMWPAGNLRIGNNGAVANFLAAAASGDIGYTNGAIAAGNGIPTGATTGFPAGTVAALCPFWDDLDPFINGGTEIWYQEANGILCIMWKAESHFVDAAGLDITFELMVFNNASGSCVPYVQFIYQDTTFGGTHAVNDHGASATIGYVAGTVGGGMANAQFSFNTAGAVGAGRVLSLVEGPAIPFGTTITSPGGTGTALVTIDGNQFCAGGTYFLAVNFALEFPQWYYGLGIGLPALFTQFSTGFPFVGPIPTVIGPLGAPSGLTVYFVTVGWPNSVAPAPYLVQTATSYTIP